MGSTIKKTDFAPREGDSFLKGRSCLGMASCQGKQTGCHKLFLFVICLPSEKGLAVEGKNLLC